ncbi:PACE efflux transporter [Halomonas icarae]|uniref:PACE efflux transporter n=1 Tax=Halomonas icarae TaxID=2691040 RepID=A0A7X4W2P8_9GAMM|nr:PACE efflux transporter [Halomonas icarae]MDR5900950.1 PACE efflux transporter [Halomonas icarae]NAW13583.1 PACE efflux transporter [Halomonas icarae]
MQGIKRRVTYVVFYELITLLIISTAFSFFSGKDAGHSTTLGVVTVMLAIVWNTVYNTLFEMWEKTRQARGRSLVRRVIHAIGFEVGFVAITLPLFAWWLEMTLLDAFMLDAGLTLFFMFFTFFYNWAFDKIFGLPLSAQ